MLIFGGGEVRAVSRTRALRIMKHLLRAVLRTLLPLAAAVAVVPAAEAQQPSFADGYHGGVYGHYPMWCTRFFVDRLAETPEWRINLEIEPETWDSVRMHTPADYGAFRAVAASPRVEFVNPAYGQPYCFNIHGESLVRHFEYGIAKLREHFPDIELKCYSSEEPCFTDCLPAVLRGFGFRYAVLKCPNTCWGGYVRGHGRGVVSWTGPSGDSIPALPRYECEGLVEGSTWQTASWNNSDEYLEACRRAGVRFPAGMCLQDAGWRNGPWIGTGAATAGGSRYVTWSEYFERVWDGRVEDTWHLTQEDIQVNLMWGSQVLQRVAQEVRSAENRAVQAEKADLMRWLGGGPAADSVRVAGMWRTLMLAQHHDCWIVPYNRVAPGRTWAEKVAEWCGGSMRTASELLGEVSAAPAFDVVNTSGVARRGVVRAEVPADMAAGSVRVVDGRGRSVPCCTVAEGERLYCLFEAETPAFGTARYRFVRGRPRRPDAACAAYAAAEGFVVENDIWRMVVDTLRGGAVVSLVDKRSGAEMVDRSSEWGFNTLRGYFYDEGRFASSTERAAHVEVEELTPLTVRVALSGTVAGEPFHQTLSLRRGDPVIECGLRIAWSRNRGIGEYDDTAAAEANRRAFKDDRYKLLLMFPAAAGRQTLYKNAPFSVCRSSLDNTFFKTWDTHKHNVVVDWVDVTGDGGRGLALMSDHTTSYAHGDGIPLSLTVQYSGRGLWGRDYPLDGPTEIRYALLPHTGTWREAGVWDACCGWNEPLYVRAAETTDAAGRSLVEIEGGGYELSSARRCGGEVEIRLFNAGAGDAPVGVSFGFGVAEIRRTRLDGTTEETLAAQSRGGRTRVEVPVPPSGFVTLRVRPSGVMP